jgi:tetratricopeptide (TPR) repeat protein
MRNLVVDALILLVLPLFLVRNLQSWEAEWFYQRGEKLAAAEKYDQALPRYEQAAALLPERAMYQRAVARNCLKLYNPQRRDPRPLYRAWKALQRLQGTEVVYPYDWFDTGEVLDLFRQAGVSGRPDPEAYFRRAWELDSTNPLFLAGWINWLSRQGKNQEARDLLPDLIISEPKAIKVFGDQFLLTPSDRAWLSHELLSYPLPNLEYARDLVQHQEGALAETQIQAIPEPEQLRPSIAYHLGNLWVALNHPDRALLVFSRAFQANPHNLTLARSWAELLAHQKDFSAAMAVYRQALRQNPSAWDLNLNLARLARSAGQQDLAIQYFSKALESNQATPAQQREIYLALAEIKIQKKNLQGALAEYQKALELNPSDSALAEKIKRLQVQLEDPSGKSPPP